MKRVFLLIAGEEYDDTACLSTLPGTKKDANAISKALLNPKYGDYNSYYSKTLYSPTWEQLFSTLNEIFSGSDQISTFTFYFAGHGIAHNGTYYLCLKNTFCDQLSTSAFPINQLFNIINDKTPKQTDIIIDACEAGGLTSDLNNLIKPEVFGSSGSPSVTLLGACNRDESAGENEEGGFATQRLLKYITGDIKIDVNLPYLDLIQIGRSISKDFKHQNIGQTPVVWGLNLTNISFFTKNPHYSKNDGLSLNQSEIDTLISQEINLEEKYKDQLWKHYLDIPNKGISHSLISTIYDITENLKVEGNEDVRIGTFLLSLAESLRSRSLYSTDTFAPVETLAAIAGAYCFLLDKPNKTFNIVIEKIHYQAKDILEKLNSHLKDEPYALLNSKSGLADLYYLPIRISKILGWIALTQKIASYLKKQDSKLSFCCDEIVEAISVNYTNSLICLSDIQSPYIFLFSQTEKFKNHSEQYNMIVQCMLKDILDNNGIVSASNIKGEEALNYLIAKKSRDYSEVQNIIARPTELLSTILHALSLVDLDDVVDPYMTDLDKVSINIFIPDDLTDFAKIRIEDGTNITIRIGSDVGEGIFNLQDYRDLFIKYCTPKIQNVLQHASEELILAGEISSLMLPDRTPWFSGKL